MLSGIDFGDATVILYANNVTIKDCTFTGTGSFWAVDQLGGVSGATVENCTFTGSKSPTEKNVWISSTLGITIEDNTFLNSPADSIALQQGVVSGNYFSGEGYATGAHADAIYVPTTTGPIAITDNFIEETMNPGAQGNSNTALRITDEFGNTNNVTVSGNYLIGAGFTFELAAPNNGYTISNVSITNNDVGFGTFGPYLPGTETLATITGLKTVDFSNPADSTQAMANYVAPTANVVSYPGPGAVGPAPVTILGNGAVSALLGSASGEANFVGGYGGQILLAQSGREHSHLSRPWRRRRPHGWIRSSEGRDRS